MVICFLAGANSIHSYKWIKYFSEKGHKVHWVSFTENNQGAINGVCFYQINDPFPFNFFKLKKLVKNIKPDIFHAHYAGVNGFVASLINYHPFVLTAWGSDILFAGVSKIKGPFVKYALKKADLITSDAKHIKNAILNFNINTAEIKIVCFGIDIKKFAPGDNSQKTGNKIISLRSFEPVYNIETLIKAIPLVLKEIPNAKFILAGKGSEEENLKELAKRLGVLDAISFVGIISQNNLPKYLQESSVYVSTSLSDAGIASSTAEAMACGLPCIITDFGDNKEWVEDGKSGFLMPARDYKFLAEKIIYLLKNPLKCEKFGQNARKIIEEKNNYYKEMEKMEKLYLKLCEQ